MQVKQISGAENKPKSCAQQTRRPKTVNKGIAKSNNLDIEVKL